MQLNIAKDIDELSEQVATWIVTYIKKTLKKQDRFTIVLSGGSTPKKLYRLLGSDYKNKIEWDRLYFFWGDERFVPYDDDRNNAKMAFENLLNHVPVNKEQVHRMRTDINVDEAAKEYEEILHSYFPDADHTFDLVLLGMGSDAHVLSLFPESDVIHEKNRWVKALYVKEQKTHRITLTVPVVNAAKQIVFLASGSDKAAALYHVFSDKHDPDFYPAQIIQPYNDEISWWVDEAAAADLE